jgi:hypothetical protein
LIIDNPRNTRALREIAAKLKYYVAFSFSMLSMQFDIRLLWPQSYYFFYFFDKLSLKRCSSADSENMREKITKIYSRQGAASKMFRDTTSANSISSHANVSL